MNKKGRVERDEVDNKGLSFKKRKKEKKKNRWTDERRISYQIDQVVKTSNWVSKWAWLSKREWKKKQTSVQRELDKVEIVKKRERIGKRFPKIK